MNLKEKILQAARADSIPAGECGRWSVTKLTLKKDAPSKQFERFVMIPPGSYTYLWCLTDGTVHKPPGECVMCDVPSEIDSHLEFMLRARGRVLVSGLGLGCVVRGLLANPAVRFVVVLERELSVLKLVGLHMPNKRVSIIHTEAESWLKKNKGRFDCAWHDVWTDESGGEEKLATKHNRLMIEIRNRVEFQGAWAFPKEFRRRSRISQLLKII